MRGGPKDITGNFVKASGSIKRKNESSSQPNEFKKEIRRSMLLHKLLHHFDKKIKLTDNFTVSVASLTIVFMLIQIFIILIFCFI